MLKRLFGLMMFLLLFGVGSAYAVCTQGDGDAICYDFEDDLWLGNLTYNYSVYTVDKGNFGLNSSSSMHITEFGNESGGWNQYYWGNTSTSNVNGTMSASMYFYFNESQEGRPTAFIGANFDHDTFSGYICGLRSHYALETFGHWFFGLTNGTQIVSDTATVLHKISNYWARLTLTINSTGYANCTAYFLNATGHPQQRSRTFTDTTYTSGQLSILNSVNIGNTFEDIYIDNISFSSGGVFGSFPLGNSAPIVSASAPVNNTETSQNLSVQFTPTDDNASTMSCSLYVDSVLNQTNSSTLNNTLTMFPMGWDDGIHTWFVNCTDGELTGTTGQYNFYLDSGDPNINSINPNIFNTTVYSGYSMQLNGNVTNVNLSEVTREVRYPNGTVFLYNQTTVFGDPTLHTWDETYNTTLEPNGNWTMWIYAKDSVNNTANQSYSFTVNNCVPDWICSGYSACNISDLAPCNTTTDNNACGLPFGAKGEQLSDFPAQACDYCDDNLDLISYGSCDIITGFKLDLYQDLNFATCCNLTNTIPSDCPFGNVSEFGLVNVSCTSQYISSYESDDIARATIDGLVIFIIALVGLAGVIALIMVFKWVRKSV